MKRGHLTVATLAGLLSAAVACAWWLWQEPTRNVKTIAPVVLSAADPAQNVRLPEASFAVRVLFGFGLKEPKQVTGSFKVTGAKLVNAELWRGLGPDRIEGDQFRFQVRRARGGVRGRRVLVPNGLVLSLADVGPDARIEFTTSEGGFPIPVRSLSWGRQVRRLSGLVRADRVPAYETIAATAYEEDFPALTIGAGMAFVAYVAHEHVGPKHLGPLQERPSDFSSFRPSGGGDQLLMLINWRGWSAPFVLTEPGLDLWRPAIVLDPGGTLHVVWSQNVHGNWDLYHRTAAIGKDWKLGPIERLTDAPGADINAQLAVASDGAVWVVWQGWRDGDFQIFARSLRDRDRLLECGVRGANEWNPAVAADRNGRLYVAFDSYAKGNYDVRLWTINAAQGKTERVVAVADSPAFEANASVACDRGGRVWVAWERRGVNWGKDQGAHYRLTGVRQPGTRLYQTATVELAWLENGRLRYPTRSLTQFLNRQALPGTGRLYSYPRLACDGQGRVWLAFRKRERWVGPAGTYWQSYVVSYDGDGWRGPILLARSDNLLDNRPSLVGMPKGGLLVCYSSDNRFRAANARQIGNDLRVSYIAPLDAPGDPQGMDVPPEPPSSRTPPVSHPNEPDDVARLRSFRLELGGKTYRIVRGEFHRHTEISPDGGGDGSLEDMWRYALDAARMDWLGCGDHDNGGGREYTWWLTQKTTDIFHHPPYFAPVFSYERSVRYPDGHRNVMFAQRGIRTLPRLRPLPGEPRKSNNTSIQDTPMLYDYLRAFGGICASHTSATDMGTDWRDNDPLAEPVVEIYQGARQNYEHRGAPRSAKGPDDAIGGWQPLGFVWRALLKGYRLGFQSSSDHGSTHISYGMVFVTELTREQIVDGFRKRHCYGATDNILMVVTSGEHLMGDEFQADKPIALEIHVEGTAPIVQLDIIRSGKYVYAVRPRETEVTLRWQESERLDGQVVWYYVRVLQSDGQLAWSSPIWVHY